MVELRKAKENVAARVKALPLAERVQAARLYELFSTIVDEEAATEKAVDALYAGHDAAILEVTEVMDALVDGRRAAEPADFAFWREHMDAAFVAPAEPDTPAPIPSYWRCFVENAGLHCGEFDEPMLDALENISLFRSEVQEEGRTLIAHRVVCLFRPNEFFTDRELAFRLIRDADDELVRSEGTAIHWKINPTVQTTLTKKKNRRTGEVRNFTKEVQKPTFFELFESYQRAEGEEEDQEESEAMNLLGVAEFVDQLEDFLPYSLEYFLDLHPEDSDDEDDDEDDDGEEGEADAEQPPPVKAAKDAANPECKNQ